MGKNYVLLFLLNMCFLSSAQKSQSHTVSFKNDNGVYGELQLKTQPTTVGYGYLWIQQVSVRIDGVEFEGTNYTNSQLKGFNFPLICTDCYFKAFGTACINFNDGSSNDCGSFSSTSIMRGALGKSSPEVNFSQATKDKHNRWRRLRDINAWEEMGAVQTINVAEVKGATINTILRKLKRQIRN